MSDDMISMDEATLRINAAHARRLEDLERDMRRLRRLNTALLLGTGILLGLAAAFVYVSRHYGVPGTVSDIVAARQFVLRGQDGPIRGVWGTEEDGTMRLVFQDAGGRPRVRLNLLNDGASGMSLVDTAGHPRAVFALLPDNSSSFAFADGSGTTRAVLGVSPDGSATLVFADNDGSTRSRIGVDHLGGGTFTMNDRQGRPVGGEPEQIEEPAQDSAPPAPRRR
jgi:hypothetical protein